MPRADPWQDDYMTTERTEVFTCPEHAPVGIRHGGYDDGKARCAVCGSYGYHVNPYMIATEVVARGWRTPDMAHATIGRVMP